MFDCGIKSYAYCPKCGTDLEALVYLGTPTYKYKKHNVYLEDCPVCSTLFVLDYNGFCEIVDKNFANTHKLQSSGILW